MKTNTIYLDSYDKKISQMRPISFEEIDFLELIKKELSGREACLVAWFYGLA